MICPAPSFNEHSQRQYRSTVLLVDDQNIVAKTVRQMIGDEEDITLHYCSDPRRAVEMANELRPTVILQDLVMPGMDGLILAARFRANPTTKEIPLIVLSSNEDPIIKADAFSVGANDYMVKLPDRLEVLARIRYHSKGYVNLIERNAAHAALEASQRHLSHEIDAGALYVRSLMPKSMSDRLQIDWRYIPCAALSGDSLGYHWFDQDRLAIYVLDVTGHGIASALLGVSVMNSLRSQALPDVDFSQPSQVLNGLNRTFEMERNGRKCFTIWYGVFDTESRVLTWAGGGHPPALLFASDAQPGVPPVELESQGPTVGMMPWDDWTASECAVAPGSRLYLYSDGAHEIHQTDGTVWPYPEFLKFMSQSSRDDKSVMDRLYEHVKSLKGADVLDDDFSIVEVRF